MARFTNLQSLALGEAKSKRPSLTFLRELKCLEDLWLEGHDKDFDAVGELLESDGFAWPQRDGLKWPHLALVDVLVR